MSTYKEIFVKFTQEGFHAYPDAPDEVAYLRDRHRHIFHYEVHIEVFHNNREIEFHLVKKFLIEAVASDPEHYNKSCEDIAEATIDIIRTKYGNKRHIAVLVSEDNENGGVAYYTPETVHAN